jgi:hypothetical protein
VSVSVFYQIKTGSTGSQGQTVCVFLCFKVYGMDTDSTGSGDETGQG